MTNQGMTGGPMVQGVGASGPMNVGQGNPLGKQPPPPPSLPPSLSVSLPLGVSIVSTVLTVNIVSNVDHCWL